MDDALGKELAPCIVVPAGDVPKQRRGLPNHFSTSGLFVDDEGTHVNQAGNSASEGGANQQARPGHVDAAIVCPGPAPSDEARRVNHGILGRACHPEGPGIGEISDVCLDASRNPVR